MLSINTDRNKAVNSTKKNAIVRNIEPFWKNKNSISGIPIGFRKKDKITTIVTVTPRTANVGWFLM